MIANISIGSSFGGIVSYHEKKIDEGKAEIIGSTEDFEFLTVKEVSNILESRADFYKEVHEKEGGRKLEKTTFHPSINFPEGEKISDELFNKIAKDYMQVMGYGNCDYLVVKHTDTRHNHVHILSSTIDRDFKRINRDNERYKSQEVSRAIEKKYGLIEVPSKWQENKKSPDLSVKKSGVKQIIDQAIKESEGKGIDVFNGKLKERGIKPIYHENKGGIYGVSFIHKEQKYKGSEVGHSWNKIKEEIEGSKTAKSLDLTDILKGAIIETKGKGIDVFNGKLKARGIKPIYHENKGGIYGISFLHNGKKYKGSEVGHSWGNIKYKLDGVKAKTKTEQSRKEVAEIVKELFSKSTESDGFINELDKLDIKPKYYQNKNGISGISFIYKEHKYTGTSIGHPWGKIKGKFDTTNTKNKESRKEVSERVKEAWSKSTEWDGFINELGKLDIKPKYYQNKNGISGISFIYKELKYSGTETGYSWGKVKGKFEEGKTRIEPEEKKKEVSERIKEAWSKSTQWDGFINELDKLGIKPKYYQNKNGISGISFIYKEQKYTGAETGYSWGKIKGKFDATNTRFKSDVVGLGESKTLNKEVTRIIEEAIKEGRGKGANAFSYSLSKKGVKLIYAENKGGIYGVSFKYQNQVYKGSEVGYSWNKIKEEIEGENKKHQGKTEVPLKENEIKNQIKPNETKVLERLINDSLKRSENITELMNILVNKGLKIFKVKDIKSGFLETELAFKNKGKTTKLTEINKAYNMVNILEIFTNNKKPKPKINKPILPQVKSINHDEREEEEEQSNNQNRSF